MKDSGAPSIAIRIDLPPGTQGGTGRTPAPVPPGTQEKQEGITLMSKPKEAAMDGMVTTKKGKCSCCGGYDFLFPDGGDELCGFCFSDKRLMEVTMENIKESEG